MTDATRVADLRCSESLLQCFHREIAAPSGTARRVRTDLGRELRMVLASLRCELRVTLVRETCVGGFEIAGPVRVAPLDFDRDDERIVDAMQVARLLVQETAARFDVAPSPEMELLVRNSRHVTRRLLGLVPRRKPAPLGSEQSLVFGHPFHPSPKARVGFDDDDLARYSPEIGASFRLRGFAVRASKVERESIDDVPLATRVADAVGAPLPVIDDFVVLPVHPWQARNLLENEEIRRLTLRGELVDLGPIGQPVFATSSVRTVVRPSASFSLKLPLDVRITNCVRRMSRREMRSCMYVTRWVREERARIASAFDTLDEVGWAAMDDTLGVLVRDVSRLHAPTDDPPRVAASLFGDRDAGRARLDRILPPSRREEFFHGYVDALVPPMLRLFFDVGLMFEPHLQNVLVSGFVAGAPVRVLLRDFDNVRVVDGLFDRARLDRVPRDVAVDLVDSFERTWERLVYCLFVNDLAEVAGALGGGDARVEARLWSIVHGAVAAFRARSSSTHVRRALADLLQRPTLPAKANFLTRLLDRDDRHAPFVGVANPLAAVSRATRKAPIAQGADATWQ